MTMQSKITDPTLLVEDEYLNAKELMELHNILIEQREELMTSTMKKVDELTQNQSEDPDILDVAVSESNRELSLRFANRERRMLGKIRIALDRITEGEYGSCSSCGVPIGYKRLVFRPVATMCIACKTEEEQLERGSW